jgi:hypothetical protein
LAQNPPREPVQEEQLSYFRACNSLKRLDSQK